MRLNIRRMAGSLNTVHHGVTHAVRGLASIRVPQPTSAPQPKPQAKVRQPKPAPTLRKQTKSQQSSFKSRMKTTSTQQQISKKAKQTAGKAAITRWRHKRKVGP